MLNTPSTQYYSKESSDVNDTYISIQKTMPFQKFKVCTRLKKDKHTIPCVKLEIILFPRYMTPVISPVYCQR